MNVYVLYVFSAGQYNKTTNHPSRVSLEQQSIYERKKGSIDRTKACSKESKTVHAGDNKDISIGFLIKKGRRRKFSE